MKTALFIIAFLSTTTIFSQTQIGNDIDGEAAKDESGSSVSLSADGNIVAIGAPENDGNGSSSGHVRVYRNDSGVWTQIGDDIDGESARDKSGHSVSLSSDGGVVAIGANMNDGNGEYSGHVRVYKNNSGAWTQIGSDIDGEAAEDESARSISLSSDGSVVAIGAFGSDANGSASGHVRVFKNNTGVWTQIGADIDGEAEGDYSGLGVSLSSDGSIVAVGAPWNDENGTSSGHVRIYKNDAGVWSQIGTDIDGETAGDYSGECVSLSSDGSVVAIGAYGNDENGNKSGQVRVYKNNAGTWTQIGANINGEASGDYSGLGVSLSSDGSVVAIGAYRNDGNGDSSGQVRVYKNKAGTWTQVGTDIDGEAAGDISGYYAVSLSSDGTVVAIGAPKNDGNGEDSGHTRIYDLSTIILGLSDKYVTEKFKVYPNPVNNQLQLQLTNTLEYKQATIYNHFGQLVLQSQTTTIDVSGLAAGAYFLEVETTNGKSVEKIIKK